MNPKRLPMEEIVKKYLLKLIVASIVAAILLFFFFELYTCIAALIVLPLISYIYVYFQAKDPAFIQRLTNPNYSQEKRSAGIKIISCIGIIVFAFSTYMSWPLYGEALNILNYCMIALAILSVCVFVWSLFKK
jgi:hypothetical protein